MGLAAESLGGCLPLTPPTHPLPALSPHLIVLDALHGELVAVHPEGVAEDGQPVKLLQLEGLGRDGDHWRAGPGQAPPTAQLELTSQTPSAEAKPKGSLKAGGPHPHLCASA